MDNAKRGSIDIFSDKAQKRALAPRLGGSAIGAVTRRPPVRASPKILGAPTDLEPLGDGDACAKRNEKIAVERCHIGGIVEPVADQSAVCGNPQIMQTGLPIGGKRQGVTWPACQVVTGVWAPCGAVHGLHITLGGMEGVAFSRAHISLNREPLSPALLTLSYVPNGRLAQMPLLTFEQAHFFRL